MFHFWKISVSKEALKYSLLAIIRLTSFLLSAQIFRAYSFSEFYLFLQNLKLPESLSFSLSFSFHLLEVLGETVKEKLNELENRNLKLALLNINQTVKAMQEIVLDIILSFFYDIKLRAGCFELMGVQQKSLFPILEAKKLTFYDWMIGFIFIGFTIIPFLFPLFM